MTRWLNSLVIVICFAVTGRVHAQHYPPQPGFQSTGYIGSPGPAYCPPGGPLYAELLPDDRCGPFGRNSGCLSPIDGYLNNAWVSFDYLHWTMKGAGGRFLGSPVTPNAVGEPFDLTGQTTVLTQQIRATDRLGTPRTTLVSGILTQNIITVPDLGGSEDEGTSGFRGSFGIPLTTGTFEASGFVLANSDVRAAFRANSQSIRIGGIPLLLDGAPNNSLFVLFSENLLAESSSRMHGFEANWVKRPFTPNVGLTLQPILGVRYLNLNDNLSITGNDVPDPNDPLTIVDRSITAETQNHVIGPQIGFRAESTMKRLTLATDLKLLFGVNSVQSQNRTHQLFDVEATEPDQMVAVEHTEFAPTLDFSVYGRYQMTNSVSLKVGYQALVGAGYVRAFDQIIYNAPATVTDPPEFGIDQDPDDFYVHGLVLGLEILLP